MDQSHVTSLAWSRKLYEAGFPQQAPIAYWVKRTKGPEAGFAEEFVLSWGIPKDQNGKPLDTEMFGAFTAEEVLARLPSYVFERDKTYGLRIEKLSPLQVFDRTGQNLDFLWSIDYYRIRDGIELAPAYPPVGDRGLSNAAAAQYCYLTSRNLLP